MASLSGDAVGPLKAARAKGLEQLLETTLEMASLSLARELTAATTDGARLRELSAYVDRWCALEARRGAMPALAEDEADEEGRCAERLEGMLQEAS